MKQMDERQYANELLLQKADGCSIRRILKKHKGRYIRLSLILAVAVAGAIMAHGSAYWMAAGIMIGALLRDYGAIKAAKRYWPFSEMMIDWVKVKIIAEGQDANQALLGTSLRSDPEG